MYLVQPIWNVSGPPDPPIDLQITPTSHDTVTLTFRSGFFNGASQTFVVEYQSQAGTQWVNGSSVFAGTEKNITLSTTIGGLDPETFYTFRCYGYNIYDKGDYADNVTVTTLEGRSIVNDSVLVCCLFFKCYSIGFK